MYYLTTDAEDDMLYAMSVTLYKLDLCDSAPIVPIQQSGTSPWTISRSHDTP